MLRKWLILGVTMASVSGLVAGVTLADDEDGPLHKLMEKVNSKGNAVKKAVRTVPAYKKAQTAKEITKHVEELLKLAKESGGMAKEAVKKAKNVKDGEKKWAELNDAYIKELEKFAELIEKPGTQQAAAKSAWGVVNQSCTNCHNDFRVEEDKF
jgi:cytochrome c556